MTTIEKTYSSQETTCQTQSRTKRVQNQNHNHNTQPTYKIEGDAYVCTNPAEMKKKLSCAKKNGICGNLEYIPGKKFFIFSKKAQYAYTSTGTETPKTIREMFGLKDGALRRCDSYIFDADRLYPKGQVVYFYEEDVQ